MGATANLSQNSGFSVEPIPVTPVTGVTRIRITDNNPQWSTNKMPRNDVDHSTSVGDKGNEVKEKMAKNDKIRRIMAHVALERNDAERPENESEEDGDSGNESVDKCESDDDDEVVAFVNESDSETQVSVNTPGSTGTRAGRLSIPNSRYLDWLA
ncbi:hypothetical protein ACROYT_G018687 [Oculina patagonica]